jgi:hypothetical protein
MPLLCGCGSGGAGCGGRAHPSERRSPPSRHGHLFPAGARRRQLHPDVSHADHAPAAHRADRAQDRQPPSLCVANR